MRKYDVGPLLLSGTLVWFPNDLSKCSHPNVLLSTAVGIEVNGLAVAKTNAEAFFDILIAFVFFRECRFSSARSNFRTSWIGN